MNLVCEWASPRLSLLTVSLSTPYFQVPRHFPFDNLYMERGGDPNKKATVKDLKARVELS